MFLKGSEKKNGEAIATMKDSSSKGRKMGMENMLINVYAPLKEILRIINPQKKEKLSMQTKMSIMGV